MFKEIIQLIPLHDYIFRTNKSSTLRMVVAGSSETLASIYWANSTFHPGGYESS
jgi:hypothetical protein